MGNIFIGDDILQISSGAVEWGLRGVHVLL